MSILTPLKLDLCLSPRNEIIGQHESTWQSKPKTNKNKASEKQDNVSCVRAKLFPSKGCASTRGSREHKTKNNNIFHRLETTKQAVSHMPPTT